MNKNNNITKNTTKYKNYWQERAEKTYLEGGKDALSVAKHYKLIKSVLWKIC